MAEIESPKSYDPQKVSNVQSYLVAVSGWHTHNKTSEMSYLSGV
jgi:hypothetical protein